LGIKQEIPEGELRDVLFDVRNYPEEHIMDFEGLLVKIACGYGSAVVHQFAEGNRFPEYVVSIPLSPLQKKAICLIYDDHYCRTRELFLKACHFKALPQAT